MSTAFGRELTRLRAERQLSLAQIAQLIPCHRGYLGQLEHGDRRPSPKLAQRLDEVLNADGVLVALGDVDHQAVNLTSPADDELEALELARRVDASDLGSAVLVTLEQAADRLAIAYQRTSPSNLLAEVRRQLDYVNRFIDKRATLDQRKRLLVVGGWLSLLAATISIDLRRHASADAWLATAASLADHTNHAEITGWVFETRAWDALTNGQFKQALDLSRAAQDAAPAAGSAVIQATAQEGRAWARIGDKQEARKALTRVEQLVSPLTIPGQPEHHYRYDPTKQLAYTVTTLSWIGDPAAETYSRDVLSRLESGRDGGTRPRRIATARIDLALTLTRTGQLDEAANQTLAALNSGRIVPSSAWRAGEIVTAIEQAGLAEAVDLRHAYQQLSHNDSP